MNGWRFAQALIWCILSYNCRLISKRTDILKRARVFVAYDSGEVSA